MSLGSYQRKTKAIKMSWKQLGPKEVSWINTEKNQTIDLSLEVNSEGNHKVTVSPYLGFGASWSVRYETKDEAKEAIYDHIEKHGGMK